MKILFLTTLSLATNPRLVKEMQLALDNGFTVEVICFTFRNWSYEINKKMLEIFTEQKVKFHFIEAGKEAGFLWLTTLLKEKTFQFLSKVVKLKGSDLATAISRRNTLIIKEIKKIQHADLVIGHNPGALYATTFAAKQLKAKAGFDVEDYHPGEGQNKFLQGLTRQLMHEVLPELDYASFAAPLIREAVKKDLGKECSNWVTVLNYFPAGEFEKPQKLEGSLKLVWFSQNISAGRGLEFIIPHLKNFVGEIQLHLYGNLDKTFYDEYLKANGNITVHEPLPQKELHKCLNNYDVGLAIEIATDLNRELCLTNKLLAYIQAGLFVWTSKTKAQEKYVKGIIKYGIVMDIIEKDCVAKALSSLVENKVQIRNLKIERFNSNNHDWETESKNLLKNWH